MRGVFEKLTATGIVSDLHRSSLFIPSELYHVENLNSGNKIMKKYLWYESCRWKYFQHYFNISHIAYLHCIFNLKLRTINSTLYTLHSLWAFRFASGFPLYLCSLSLRLAPKVKIRLRHFDKLSDLVPAPETRSRSRSQRMPLQSLTHWRLLTPSRSLLIPN